MVFKRRLQRIFRLFQFQFIGQKQQIVKTRREQSLQIFRNLNEHLRESQHQLRKLTVLNRVQSGRTTQWLIPTWWWLFPLTRHWHQNVCVVLVLDLFHRLSIPQTSSQFWCHLKMSETPFKKEIKKKQTSNEHHRCQMFEQFL